MGRTGIGVIWLCVCCVIQTSLGQLVNVARGKTYSQSTQFSTGYPSSNAANGNTDGTFSTTNCIHTHEWRGSVDSSPWWQVDLGRNYTVFNITVWARAGYVDRLYPLTITVDGQQCVRVNSSNSREQSLSCTSPMSGRVVRLNRGDRKVSQDKAVTLNLCEVQIWSTCQDGDYNNGTACVPCSSTCKNNQCNSDTGRCDSCRQGWHGERCELSCADHTSRCTQCVQDGGQCTVCSDNLAVPQCTACRQGWYGDRCELSCADRTSRCTQCAQDGGQCTVCSDNLAVPQCTDCVDGFYKTGTSCTKCTWKCDKDAPCNKTTGHCAECPPGKKGDQCDQAEEDKDNDSLVGPIVGAIVGSILGAGLLIAISVFAAIRWRRKSNGSGRKDTTVEMASAPANNLSDSAITGPHPPPPSSSTPGVEGNVYEVVDNDNDKNKGLTRQPAQPSSSSTENGKGSVYKIEDNDNDTNTLPTAPPPSSSTAGEEGRHYENEIQVNIYNKLCPHANDDRDRELYTELDDVTTKT